MVLQLQSRHEVEPEIPRTVGITSSSAKNVGAVGKHIPIFTSGRQLFCLIFDTRDENGPPFCTILT